MRKERRGDRKGEKRKRGIAEKRENKKIGEKKRKRKTAQKIKNPKRGKEDEREDR